MFRRFAVLVLIGLAGCSGAAGLLPGGWHSMDRATLNGLVQTAAKKTGVDHKLIAAVIETESHGDPGAVSRVGAQGLMQLMPETARQYNVLDPFDPAQNVNGGSRYLRDLLRRYHHDVHLALAAYNAGPANVDAAKGVPKYPETQAYVARVLASLK
jgi:soluble lytic murein transglycosylase-like protein